MQSKEIAPPGYRLLRPDETIMPYQNFYMIWNAIYKQWVLVEFEPINEGKTQAECSNAYARPLYALGSQFDHA